MADPVKWPRPAWWLKFKISPGGCWIWTGRVNNVGYGLTDVVGEHSVHRATYRIFVGPVPEGLQLDHLCRVRLCANPSHLEAVTSEENAHRRDQAKRSLLR